MSVCLRYVHVKDSTAVRTRTEKEKEKKVSVAKVCRSSTNVRVLVS